MGFNSFLFRVSVQENQEYNPIKKSYHVRTENKISFYSELKGYKILPSVFIIKIEGVSYEGDKS